MGAYERDKIGGCEALGLEESDKVSGWGISVGKEASGCGLCGVFAANEGDDSRPSWAGDRGVVVGVLNEVGVADVELGLYGAENSADVL